MFLCALVGVELYFQACQWSVTVPLCAYGCSIVLTVCSVKESVIWSSFVFFRLVIGVILFLLKQVSEVLYCLHRD